MGGRQLTVLVVDDDPSIRLLCRVNLEIDGERVLEAGSVSEARAALAREPVDVVLLDARLGSEDGRRVLETVRQEQPDAGVAMLTGSPERHETGGDADADEVIAKPFDVDELGDAVRRLAGRAGQGRV